jgi:hypothetical protein
MRRIAWFAVLSVCLGMPSLMRAQNSGFANNHLELGAFVDYFRLSSTTNPINFVGVGGRVGFNVHPNVALEAEMAYDFERNFTSTFSNGVTTNFVRTSARPIHALFGPKFQAGTSGPIRVFVTGKVGFVNFSTSTASPLSGFTNSVSYIPTGNTPFAFYPGAGIEMFGGPIGLRIDVGDDIYFDNGTRNNLKATIGPVIRF